MLDETQSEERLLRSERKVPVCILTTIKALVSGHPREAEKVSATGTYGNAQIQRLYRSSNGVLSSWPQVELSAYESVPPENFDCTLERLPFEYY